LNKKEKNTRREIKLPRAVYITICVLPFVSTALFYMLRSNTVIMDRAARNFSAPVRSSLGLISSLYPFSLTENIGVIAGIWLIYYIIKTIVVTARRREKLKILSRRLLTVAVVFLYAWSLFCWLWNSGYHAPGFADKHGFTGKNVTTENLIDVTRMFAAKANELAPLVKRDENGEYIENRNEIFTISTNIYNNVFIEFPQLRGSLYKPKSMVFSWLMSRTGYTGIYFALTGESLVNTRAPAFLLPATIAHELAHQRGVFAEDEANFVGILACVTSGYTAYEYAGYLMGLMYLQNALFPADFLAWTNIRDSLSVEVNKDLRDNYNYWQSQKTVKTGIELLDSILTTVTVTVSDAVNTAYDSFLKSQDQELGLKSYGACVDLLIEYFCENGIKDY